MPPPPSRLPNAITLGRIAACPVIFALAMAPGAAERFGAFALFVVAGLSDVWDGHLARKHGWVTDVGRLLDPIADKLLLAATFVPFYLISHAGDPAGRIPWWGPLPVWVVVVVFGREALITIFRVYAARRGVVIAAGWAGKRKALLQALFAGGLLLWYPLAETARALGWSAAGWWRAWSFVHEAWVAVTLAVAVFLTVYSMLDYLWRYRAVTGIRP